MMIYDRRWGLPLSLRPSLRRPPGAALLTPPPTFETTTFLVAPYLIPISLATRHSEQTRNEMAENTLKDRLHLSPRTKDPCTVLHNRSPDHPKRKINTGISTTGGIHRVGRIIHRWKKTPISIALPPHIPRMCSRSLPHQRIFNTISRHSRGSSVLSNTNIEPHSRKRKHWRTPMRHSNNSTRIDQGS